MTSLMFGSRLRPVFSALLFAAALGAAACGGDDDGDAADGIDAGDGDGDGDGVDAGSNPACTEANDHSDLAWLEQKVFTPSCAAFASCHQGAATQAGGLNLEAGMVESSMVNVQAMSPAAGGIDLVEPGDPENSYLLVILGHYGTDDPRIDPDVGTMPYNSAPLCEEKRSAVERWIESL